MKNLIQDYVINKYVLNNLFFRTNYSTLYKYNNLIIKQIEVQDLPKSL